MSLKVFNKLDETEYFFPELNVTIGRDCDNYVLLDRR